MPARVALVAKPARRLWQRPENPRKRGLRRRGGLARQQYGAYFLGPEAATFPIFSAYSGGVDVSYDLDVFGGTRRSIELAAADKDVQQEALRAAQLSIAGATVLEALQIASTRAQIDVVNIVVASDQRTLRLVQSQKAEGAVSDQDVTTAQSQLDRDRTLLPALHQQLNIAQDALATLVGSSPADWSAPYFSLAGMSLPRDVPLVVPSELVRSRPDIRAAEAQLHAASAEVGIATANLYPRISLSASVAEQVYLLGRQVRPGASSAGSARRSFTEGRSPRGAARCRTPTRLPSRNISRRC
jgi:NodT family efflux transporter outer membrane factor (OMF) lipoprotein